jgi:hypothetical protein
VKVRLPLLEDSDAAKLHGLEEVVADMRVRYARYVRMVDAATVDGQAESGLSGADDIQTEWLAGAGSLTRGSGFSDDPPGDATAVQLGLTTEGRAVVSDGAGPR